MEPKKALLIVDVQKDFCPGGKLAVPEGDKIIKSLNKYIGLFQKRDWPIFLSRDWHPEESSHFKDFGGKWPKHCIANSKGAEFHEDLNIPAEAVIVSKGMNPEKDSYSAFQAENSEGDNLLSLLKSLNISELYVGGLATDFCVRHSVLDGLSGGLKVKLMTDAIKGIDADDSAAAKEEMIKEGAQPTTLNELIE